MKWLRFLFFGALIFSFWACSPDNAGVSSPIGGEWVLSQLNGKALPEGNRPPTLVIPSAQGKIYGFSGVNNYQANCTIDGGSIRIIQLVSTRMAGNPEAMRLERDFGMMLGHAETWRIENGELLLFDGMRILARFYRKVEKEG